MATALPGRQAARASLCNRLLDMVAPMQPMPQLRRRIVRHVSSDSRLAVPQTLAQALCSRRLRLRSSAELRHNQSQAEGLKLRAATVRAQQPWAHRRLSPRAVETRRATAQGCHPPRRHSQLKTGASLRAPRSLLVRRSEALRHRPCWTGNQLHLVAPQLAAKMALQAIGRLLNLASVASLLAVALRALTAPQRLILLPALVVPQSHPPAGKQPRCLLTPCLSFGLRSGSIIPASMELDTFCLMALSVCTSMTRPRSSSHPRVTASTTSHGAHRRSLRYARSTPSRSIQMT